MNEPVRFWLLLAVSMAGTFMPHLFAHAFLDDHRIVRSLSIPLLLVSACVLIDFYVYRLV